MLLTKTKVNNNNYTLALYAFLIASIVRLINGQLRHVYCIELSTLQLNNNRSNIYNSLARSSFAHIFVNKFEYSFSVCILFVLIFNISLSYYIKCFHFTAAYGRNIRIRIVLARKQQKLLTIRKRRTAHAYLNVEGVSESP